MGYLHDDKEQFQDAIGITYEQTGYATDYRERLLCNYAASSVGGENALYCI